MVIVLKNTYKLCRCFFDEIEAIKLVIYVFKDNEKITSYHDEQNILIFCTRKNTNYRRGSYLIITSFYDTIHQKK